MGGLVGLIAIFCVFGLILGGITFMAYRRTLRRAKGVERGLKMVPLLIHLPPPSDDTENSGSRPVQDIMREKVKQAEVLYELIAGTAQPGFKSNFFGQRHIAFEIVASNGLVHYFAAVPIALVGVVEQAVVTAYPGARLEEVEDHNIFNPQGRLTGTVGGELVLRHEAAYPIALIEQMERDPMEAMINSLYKLQLGDGAAIQFMLRPANPKWSQRSIKLVAKKRHSREGGLGFGVADIAKGAVKTSEEWREKAKTFEPSKLEEQMMQGIEDKTRHPAYEVLVRVLVSSPSYDRSELVLRNLITSFALFEAPGSNGFQFIEGRDVKGLVTAFIFRFFPPELTSTVLNSVELATLFHLPDAQFTSTTQVERQQSKQVDGPSSMPATGLLLGYNFYRGTKKEIRLSPEDRRRHFYAIGQTGTGKSTMLENLAVQDMLAGNGFAFIDPHGDTAEKLLSMVPKERAEDVIYFNPGDMDRPLGLNIFEFKDPSQKSFLIQESINMLYKLYDPGKTGIIGPRFEHWYRNAALTLMADPNGASFIELPKVFTDSGYLKDKFKYLTDPTVIDFWTKEMAQTSDYHKSEMLGWFVSKFGAFQSDDMMRNIIGQTHSAFDLRDIMDNKKILIVNLSKGRVGEINSQLLGMIFVIKIQAAAMSRANVPEDQRPDFCLYVDEFQNFSTDSFAAILSEARKYHLNLIVANQFIGQLTDDIREAVFGNIGTMLSYRCGPEDAEFLVKQFEPIFDQRDLVGLPNHNAIMKLLVGGLPSQPFSITALPPLGLAHHEMGLAIQQLSAAKYGVQRATVEADIFARLQSQPSTVVPNAATAALTPAPAPKPVAPPAPPAAAEPAKPSEPPKPPEPSVADTQDLLPSRTPSMKHPPQSPSSNSRDAVQAPAPTPKPQPPVPTPDGLSLDQLRATAPQPEPEPEPRPEPPKPEPQPDPSPPAPVVATDTMPLPSPKAEPKPPTLIEAHETDGMHDQGNDLSTIEAELKEAGAQLQQLVPREAPKRIESHEADGLAASRSAEPARPQQHTSPVFIPPKKPEPKSQPEVASATQQKPNRPLPVTSSNKAEPEENPWPHSLHSDQPVPSAAPQTQTPAPKSPKPRPAEQRPEPQPQPQPVVTVAPQAKPPLAAVGSMPAPPVVDQPQPSPDTEQVKPAPGEIMIDADGNIKQG
jgi:hypothetical protein